MKNKITTEEARDALRDIEWVEKKAKNLVLMDFLTLPLLLFGVIWALSYMLGYFYMTNGFRLLGVHPDRIAGVISILGSVVVCVSVICKLRYANPVRSKGTWFGRFGAALLPVPWFLFYVALSEFHSFETGWQRNVHDSIYWMFMFVVYGFWFANGLFLTVGVLVSAWALIGYHFFPRDLYALWMAVMAGGTLLGGGVYAMLKGRTFKNGVGDES